MLFNSPAFFLLPILLSDKIWCNLWCPLLCKSFPFKEIPNPATLSANFTWPSFVLGCLLSTFVAVCMVCVQCFLLCLRLGFWNLNITYRVLGTPSGLCTEHWLDIFVQWMLWEVGCALHGGTESNKHTSAYLRSYWHLSGEESRRGLCTEMV